MRKLILSLQMSLDGVASDPEKWMTLSDEILESAIAYYDTLDAILVGGNSYAGLADYWQQAEPNFGSETERRFARKINDIKKIVFSRSPMDLTWQHSEQLFFDDTDSLAQQIQQLKNSDGKNISVESGLKSWQLFLKLNLFDELVLGVHPVVAGQGEKLFADTEAQLPLQLITSKVYQNGVVELHYQKG
ncbi:dihydrofolate reductase family protein [Larkinella insperata]|uniref:Dihydrofolate reductase family protein n=1 Tax=Larkinella insperata TaxID=332158 RepID=A0ABW3QJP3_9BACT|nr:dihydrofolate reductase family protein [Larkinella insperata]